jgi:hypothetical protein
MTNLELAEYIALRDYLMLSGISDEEFISRVRRVELEFKQLKETISKLPPERQDELQKLAEKLNIARRIPELVALANTIEKFKFTRVKIPITKRDEDKLKKVELRLPIFAKAVRDAQLLPPAPTPIQEREQTKEVIQEQKKEVEAKIEQKEKEVKEKEKGFSLIIPIAIGAAALALFAGLAFRR